MSLNNVSAIYSIKNVLNGKRYIGQAINVSKRWTSHRNKLKNNNHENLLLQNSWNKYGGNNFIFEIIEVFPNDKELLNNAEVYWICYYNSFWQDGCGYNLTRGSSNHIGIIVSEERKEQLRESMSGESNPMYGKHHTEETKNKISKLNKGRTLSKEILEKRKENKKPVTSETRKKLSKVHRGKKIRKNSSSKYLNVYYVKKTDRWTSSIWYDSKSINLGWFDSEVEAAITYNNKALELWGEEAILNDITEEDVEFGIKDAQERKLRRESKMASKYRGVVYKKDVNKWVAKLQINKKKIYIGAFETEKYAAYMYNLKVLELGIDPNRLNEIEESEIPQIIADEEKLAEIRPKPTSKYKYVFYNQENKKYRAAIDLKDYNCFLGSFKYELEAALAVNEALLEFYGPKAKLNKITPEEIENLWNLE